MPFFAVKQRIELPYPNSSGILTTAGGLVVIDNIEVNGTLVGKGSSTSTSRDD